MSGSSKKRITEIQQIARRLIAESGIELGNVTAEAHGAHLEQMKGLRKSLIAETHCHRDTARKYVAWAMRRERYDVFVQPRGGARDGAGAKVKPETPDKFVAYTTANYDIEPLEIIATAPTEKVLQIKIDDYFAKSSERSAIEYNNNRITTMAKYRVELLKQQKHWYALKNH